MFEWKDQFNSFNSYKGLLYSKHYQAIRDWKDGKIKAPLPSIEVSLDPIHACNLFCQHCNFHKYLEEADKTKFMMTNAHIINLVRFLAQWGVSAICWGGGGEHTLHPKLGEGLELSKVLGLENSIATNGTLFTDNLIKIMAETCRWVGVSIDSANPNTYKIGRNKDLFDITIKNLGKLSDYIKKTKSKCDVSYKFLIFSYNQEEIFEACKLAKKIGVKDFHARPADYRHQGLGEWQVKRLGYNVKLIEEQFKQCHEIEDENFRVFTVTHKFNEDFTPRRKFTQCYASPICIQLCANGSIYLCPDCRHLEFYKLGEHYPNPENILNVWGSEKHYDLVFKEGCNKCNSRCTFSPYNEQCERIFINDNDPFCRNFV